MYTMRPAEFTYHRPGSLDEALALLDENGDARVLAGGHSLLPLMKMRLVSPAALIDLDGIPDLGEIAEDGDSLTIGALASHASVASSDLVRRRCPVLAETAEVIGDRQVRNRGTIGGSLAHADPGADYPTVVTALGAAINAAGRTGRRQIAADEFFRGLFTTALEPGEVVTAVTVPATAGRSGAAYMKHAHPASGYAVAGAAAVVSLEGGRCTGARVTIGGVAERPVDATSAADALVGAAPSDDAVAAAAAKVSDGLTGTIDDTYASAEYRVHLATVLARRALSEAFARAA